MHRIRPITLLSIALFLLGALLWFVSRESLLFSNFSIIVANEAPRSISLPFHEKSPQTSIRFTILGSITIRAHAAKSFRIIPDDCLVSMQIGGKTVDLSGVPPSSLCNWNEGFLIDLSSYLVAGENIAVFELNDHGNGEGLYAFNIRTAETNALLGTIRILAYTLLLAAFIILIWMSHFSLKQNNLMNYLSQPKHLPIFFILVVCISYFTHFKGYDKPAVPIWDENYHIASAQKYLTGTYFMEPHPPLGKMLVALGEKIFKANASNDQFTALNYAKDFPGGFSFRGYRFFSSLFSWWTAAIFFLICLYFTTIPFTAFLLSFLYIFDNALIVQNRAAMLEGPLLFFSAALMLNFLYLLKHPKRRLLYLCFGTLLALVVSTKLLGLSLACLFAPVLWKLRHDLKLALQATFLCICSFLLVFCLIWQIHFAIAANINPQAEASGYYNASAWYRSVIDQKQTANLKNFTGMLYENIWFGTVKYQSGVPKLDFCKANEAGSPPLYWPFGAKTVRFRWDTLNGTDFSYLYLQSNPLVWFCGLLGILLSLALLTVSYFFSIPLQNRFLLGSFSWLYVAYMFAVSQLTRVMYLYHYFIALLASLVLFVLVLQEIKQLGAVKVSENGKTIFLFFLALLIVVVFWFYSPFTYHWPLTNQEFRLRAWLDFWNLRCAQC